MTHGYSVAATSRRRPSTCARRPTAPQYQQGAAVAVAYSCADEGGSGLASCTGDVPDGGALDTSTPGAHDFTVVARDGDGNETTVTHSYTVTEPPTRRRLLRGLDFQGFLGPIHDGSVVRAGDAIPIVFSLGGDQGLDVLADGSPTSVQTDCGDPGTPTGGDPASSESRPRPDLQLAGPATTSSRGRPRRRGRGPAAPSCWACATAASQRLTVSFRSSWRWRPHS